MLEKSVLTLACRFRASNKQRRSHLGALQITVTTSPKPSSLTIFFRN